MKKWFPIFSIMLLAVMLITGCSETAQTGDNVKVIYTGTLDDGTEFDSSAGREPLEFTIDDGVFKILQNLAVADGELQRLPACRRIELGAVV